jgi:hypothetical protein
MQPATQTPVKMSGITFIMFGPLVSYAHAEFEISETVNEVLDYNIMGQCSLGDDSDFDDDYTQFQFLEHIQLVAITV